MDDRLLVVTRKPTNTLLPCCCWVQPKKTGAFVESTYGAQFVESENHQQLAVPVNQDRVE